MITPRHPLFKEYQQAFHWGDWEGVAAVQSRARSQERLALHDRWKAWLKTENPAAWFKHIHSEACLNFGKTRSL